MRARLVVGILVFVSCRRPDDRHTAAAASPISPPAASVATTKAGAWSGKSLHVWITACDETSDEAADILGAIAKRPGVFDSVGVACTTVTDAGKLATVAEFPVDQGRAKIASKLTKAGVRTSLVIANTGPNGFDGPLAKKVLDGDASRMHLLELIMDAAMRGGFRDVELDLESMPTSAGPKYTKLAKDAVARVLKRGGEVVVDVHPKTIDTPNWDGPGAHEYAALAASGAVVRLMTYDMSIGPVPPGPSTRATWARDVVKYAKKKGVPSDKLELGLPAYGYDFSPKDKLTPVALRYTEVMALRAKMKAEIKRDEFGSPHFEYTAADGKHQVWFDDAISIGRLLSDLSDIAPDVRGVAIWGIGRADPDLGKLLADAGF
jgi:spore germination protein YaaH